MLAGDLDSTVEADRAVLDRLLDLLVNELEMQTDERTPPDHHRTNRRELQLVIMRLLSEFYFLIDLFIVCKLGFCKLIFKEIYQLKKFLNCDCDKYRTVLLSYLMSLSQNFFFKAMAGSHACQSL